MKFRCPQYIYFLFRMTFLLNWLFFLIGDQLLIDPINLSTILLNICSTNGKNRKLVDQEPINGALVAF